MADPSHSTRREPLAKPTRVLFVGAGAVGQLVGWHASRAGAHISYYVRPKYAQEVARGFTFHEHRTVSAAPPPHTLTPDAVLTGLGDLADTHFDQVYLCMSSTALRRGDWFEHFAAALNADVLISFQPGPEDQAFLERHWPAEFLIMGMIGFVAYQAPLPQESLPQDTLAFWHPPSSKSMVSGDPIVRDQVYKLLRRGEMPIDRTESVPRSAGLATAFLSTFLIGLELEGWSWKAVRSGGRLGQVTAAQREALKIMALHHHIAPPPWRALLRAGPTALAVGLAPRLTPFDLEVYFRYHFTKVGDQTRDTVKTYLALADVQGVSAPALRDLYEELVMGPQSS